MEIKPWKKRIESRNGEKVSLSGVDILPNQIRDLLFPPLANKFKDFL